MKKGEIINTKKRNYENGVLPRRWRQSGMTWNKKSWKIYTKHKIIRCKIPKRAKKYKYRRAQKKIQKNTKLQSIQKKYRKIQKAHTQTRTHTATTITATGECEHKYLIIVHMFLVYRYIYIYICKQVTKTLEGHIENKEQTRPPSICEVTRSSRNPFCNFQKIAILMARFAPFAFLEILPGLRLCGREKNCEWSTETSLLRLQQHGCNIIMRCAWGGCPLLKLLPPRYTVDFF